MHIDNPIAMVKIILVNLHEMWLNGLCRSNEHTLSDGVISIGGQNAEKRIEAAI